MYSSVGQPLDLLTINVVDENLDTQIKQRRHNCIQGEFHTFTTFSIAMEGQQFQ